MSLPKVNEKGKVMGYPSGRKKTWKRLVSKARRKLGQKAVRKTQ